MDSTDLNLPGASYDRILLFFLLHEQPRHCRERTLSEAFRLVKPGGKIVFSFLEFRLESHWFIFEHSVKDRRADKVLNQFIDRDMIRSFATHLGVQVESLHDGHVPHIPLDRTVRWDSGQEMTGMGYLGQSVCVLTK